MWSLRRELCCARGIGHFHSEIIGALRFQQQREQTSGFRRILGMVCRVGPEHSVRGPNEAAVAIQPYGMEEHRPLHHCMMSGDPMKYQWSLRRMRTVSDGYG
eukprot:11740830-Heterocapsa_arctica.AAC.1